VPPGFNAEPFCYLTTTGRVTGRPHEIEIWFVLQGSTVYMMNGDTNHPGGSADWVRNLRKDPAVTLRIRDQSFSATGRIVTDPEEDALVRRLIRAKYPPGDPQDSSWWGYIALPVAIDVHP
jgi:deazaflavin-dependent oxidoreductase (nitroreductase family)